MAYLVDISNRAHRDLEHVWDEINAADSIAAARWFNGLEEAVQTLARFPKRCPSAPESKRARLPLRHLLYGKKPHIYRIIFEIDEMKKVVRVLTIRHGAMRPARPDELRKRA